MAQKKKGGGGKLSRSETVTVRLDPKLRFAAELAARKQRRTLSSFIEWAVEESIHNVILAEPSHINEPPETAYTAIERVWDVDEADRFAKFALNYPNLLTHNEEILWKLICENGCLWKGRPENGEWTWEISQGSLIFKRLREYWDTFKKVATGEMDKGQLPTGLKEIKAEEEKDDDIPY